MKLWEIQVIVSMYIWLCSLVLQRRFSIQFAITQIELDCLFAISNACVLQQRCVIVDKNVLELCCINKSIDKIIEIQYCVNWPESIVINLVEIKHVILDIDVFSLDSCIKHISKRFFMTFLSMMSTFRVICKKIKYVNFVWKKIGQYC